MLSLRKLAYGSASNILRLLLSVFIAVSLPPLLVRHLAQAEYSAWVLILQLSAYVGVMDLGLQTIISKLVAEYSAKEDRQANHLLLSSSFSLLAMLSIVGLGAAAVMVWKVPSLFHQMPISLIPQVRISLLLISLSAAFGLPFGSFLAVFIGLQEYGFPTAVGLVNRISSTLLLVGMVLLGKGLVAMAIAFTIVNVLTSVAQWVGWRHYAKARIGFSAFAMDVYMVKHLVRSGGMYAIWTLGFLLVSGVDVVIVGRYDYCGTGFYSIAASATNFMLMCVVGVISPLLPAVSAMQAKGSSKDIGAIAIQSTRFCGILLCLVALPLLLAGYSLLSLWVGNAYALRSVAILQILVLAGVVRTIGFPYGTIVIATGQQHLATLSVVSEAVVNLALSIWLVQRFGAIGVAYGTLAGAFVGNLLHLTVSIRLTQQAIRVSKMQFLLQGMMRPLVCTLPLFLSLPILHWNAPKPPNAPLSAACALSILLFLLRFGLTAEDRRNIYLLLARLRGFVHSNI